MITRPVAVAPLSKVQLESYSLDVRRTLGHSDDQAVDMLRVIEFILPQVFPDFWYDVVDDHELGGAEATTSTKDRIIRISDSCYDSFMNGGLRPQFTLAHELGHLLLHTGKPFHLARGEVKAYADPEWQADTFAAAFLTPESLARQCRSAEEMSARFRISMHAANVRASRLGLPFAQKKGH